MLKTQRFADLYPLLLKRAELPEDTKLAIYEEIKFDPTVMVELQNPNHSLANAQLEDGDILCLQEQPREVSTFLAAEVPRAICPLRQPNSLKQVMSGGAEQCCSDEASSAASMFKKRVW